MKKIMSLKICRIVVSTLLITLTIPAFAQGSIDYPTLFDKLKAAVTHDQTAETKIILQEMHFLINSYDFNDVVKLAAEHGALGSLQELLKINPGFKTNQATLAAFHNQQENILRFLLPRTQLTPDEMTMAISESAANDFLYGVDTLLPMLPNLNRVELIEIAFEHEGIRIAQYLLNHGVSVNDPMRFFYEGKWINIPMIAIVSHLDRNGEETKLLIHYGANPLDAIQVHNQGRGPFHFYYRDPETIRALLTAWNGKDGADEDSITNAICNEELPLETQKEFIKLVVDKGFNFGSSIYGLETKDGVNYIKTAKFSPAYFQCGFELTETIHQISPLTFKEQDSSGSTILHYLTKQYASYVYLPESDYAQTLNRTLDFMVKNGADVNQKNKEGFSVLSTNLMSEHHASAGNYHFLVFEHLLQLGAKVDSTENIWPQITYTFRHMPLGELLELNYDVNLVNEKGNSPAMSLAAEPCLQGAASSADNFLTLLKTRKVNCSIKNLDGKNLKDLIKEIPKDATIWTQNKEKARPFFMKAYRKYCN